MWMIEQLEIQGAGSKTHGIADVHVIFKPNKNITMTHFLFIEDSGGMNASWYRQ